MEVDHPQREGVKTLKRKRGGEIFWGEVWGFEAKSYSQRPRGVLTW